MMSVKCTTATLLTCLLWSASVSGADSPVARKPTNGADRPADSEAMSAADSPTASKPGGGPETPSADASSPGALRLSLHDALELTMTHNLELQVWQQDTRIAEGAVTAARGPFDPTLTASAPGIVGQDPVPFSSTGSDPGASSGGTA